MIFSVVYTLLAFLKFSKADSIQQSIFQRQSSPTEWSNSIKTIPTSSRRMCTVHCLLEAKCEATVFEVNLEICKLLETYDSDTERNLDPSLWETWKKPNENAKVCPNSFWEVSGNYYIILTNGSPQVDQAGSQTKCQTLGSNIHLAELDTMAEFNAVQQHLTSLTPPTSQTLYIGASAPGFTGNFKWINSGVSVQSGMWKTPVVAGAGDTAAMDFAASTGLLFQHDSGDPGATKILCECM